MPRRFMRRARKRLLDSIAPVPRKVGSRSRCNCLRQCVRCTASCVQHPAQAAGEDARRAIPTGREARTLGAALPSPHARSPRVCVPPAGPRHRPCAPLTCADGSGRADRLGRRTTPARLSSNLRHPRCRRSGCARRSCGAVDPRHPGFPEHLASADIYEVLLVQQLEAVRPAHPLPAAVADAVLDLGLPRPSRRRCTSTPSASSNTRSASARSVAHSGTAPLSLASACARFCAAMLSAPRRCTTRCSVLALVPTLSRRRSTSATTRNGNRLQRCATCSRKPGLIRS